MNKIAVTTDTNSGMFPGEMQENGVFVLPMPFIIDGASMLESVELSREHFFEKLKSDASISTSQPSVAEVTDFWTDILKEYDEIVHIPTSSLLSNSCATAQTLAKEFDGKVRVVDNLRISAPLKASVMDAVKLRDRGLTAEEIAKTLEDTACDYSVYVSTESIHYLKKGGRISAAAAAIGSILKLRPVLHLYAGKLDKHATPRTEQKSMEIMLASIESDLKERFKEYTDKGEMRICVIYGEKKEATEPYLTEIKKRFPDIPVIFNDPMSLSVSCHTGPGSVALGCVRAL